VLGVLLSFAQTSFFLFASSMNLFLLSFLPMFFWHVFGLGLIVKFWDIASAGVPMLYLRQARPRLSVKPAVRIAVPTLAVVNLTSSGRQW
jgi:hypothetical protein